MLKAAPTERPTIDTVLKHPLFWSLDEKLAYLCDVGSVLPVRLQKTEHSFINELERTLDAQLGAYNEHAPAEGGSWARALGDQYPLSGSWGKSQRPPADEENSYHIYGAPPSKKQAAERQRQLDAGKLTKTFKAKEIRSVGLLKFIRNIFVHRAEQVEAGRFDSEDAVKHYLLDPFPWLLMAAYAADEKHKLTKRFASSDSTNGGNGPTQPQSLPLPASPHGVAVAAVETPTPPGNDSTAEVTTTIEMNPVSDFV